tara:strand:- start:4587 stop:6209 length:1623 start_codon:yes stop_codon:yes gene_type:complete
MTVSPTGYWLLDRMIFLTNKILKIINEKGIEIITNLLKDSNTFTGINTFKGGINVDTINSINKNTTFNSEIFINGNITSNNGIFIGNTLDIGIIERNTTSKIITFKSNILMDDNNIYDVDGIFGNIIFGNIIFGSTINIDDISLKSSILPYITVNDDIRFSKDINVNGNLIIDGSTITVDRETLTINDSLIILNANIEKTSIKYTPHAGIIVNTHDTTEHNTGYLLWKLFDPNNPSNEDLNRTWDLSGDNLRGNVLKATTIRGNILDSYYSPNISVISDIDMNNNDISNINTLTSTDLNIDVIKTNTASNISVLNTIDMNNNNIYDVDTLTLNNIDVNLIKTTRINYLNTQNNLLQKFIKVINTTTIAVGYNIEDISGNITAVNDIFNKTQFFNLSEEPSTFNGGHWITGIDLNILTCGYTTGILQHYQNFKLGITYKVTENDTEWWPSFGGETFPHIYDNTFSFPDDDIDIYIKKISGDDVNVYLIAKIRRNNNSSDDINQFSFAIFNSYTTNSNYLTKVQYVLDMTVSNSSKYPKITV